MEALHLLKSCELNALDTDKYDSAGSPRASPQTNPGSCSAIERDGNLSHALCPPVLARATHPIQVLLVTNGEEASTRGYAEQAGVFHLVDRILSCDEVGYGKPLPGVYEVAMNACDHLQGASEGMEQSSRRGRWFVAAHLWDLGAARKAGLVSQRLFLEHCPYGPIWNTCQPLGDPRKRFRSSRAAGPYSGTLRKNR